VLRCELYEQAWLVTENKIQVWPATKLETKVIDN
jgi:hypothetical protein